MELITTSRANYKPDFYPRPINPAIRLSRRYGITLALAAIIAELANIGQRRGAH